MHNRTQHSFPGKNLALRAFYFLIALSLFSACNKTDKKAEQATKPASRTEAGSTDSVFVESYLKQNPVFKEHSKLVKEFYKERNYALAWFKHDKLIPQADRFLEAINTSHRDGLNPKDYKLKDFQALYEKYKQEQDDSKRKEEKAELDIALTGSYFKYSTDFYRGQINPKDKGIDIDWNVKGNSFKPIKALQTILKERESRYPYYQFEPLHDEYERLRLALAKYREYKKKGGWQAVSLGSLKKLEPGDSSEAVPAIRKRLQAEGFTIQTPTSKNVNGVNSAFHYDESLAQAVKEYQDLNGLRNDGIIGAGTLEVMNVPVQDRIDQIILNMERWRWVPKRLPERHIFVNIPEYKLHVIENDKEVLNMKVIVGKEMNSTPIFSDRLEYIVFSPFWNVTPNILVDEVVPAQLKNPNFLESQDMEVVKDLGHDKVEVIPTSSIDWSAVEKDWKMRVRQRPGKKNPLGYVKFIFPNEYDVYLHDTPSDALFNQTKRGFSHGCIRIEKPEDLALYLLDDQPAWDLPRIKQAEHAGQEKYVNIKKRVLVYIVYFTTWADPDGKVHFRNDIYGHDKELAQAFFGS